MAYHSKKVYMGYLGIGNAGATKHLSDKEIKRTEIDVKSSDGLGDKCGECD